MRTKRYLSFLMALVMLAGMIVPLLSFPVYAAEEEEEEEEFIDYRTVVYETPEDKLYAMGEPVYVKQIGDSEYQMEMYYMDDTGEVAVRNTQTKQILFTNPYNVGSLTAASTVKDKLLSQLILTYKDSANQEIVFDSYTYAASNRQIQMKKIKGGIRVEYAIGNTQKKRVVPRYITQERFESMIKGPMEEANEQTWKRFAAWYQLKDANDPKLNARTKAEILKTYPITAKKPIYVIDPEIADVDRELEKLEGYIKTYTKYTLEDMLQDHDECNYVLEDDSPPLFKMSLEYYLNDDGVSVNMPARGISYDTGKYKLLDLQILPYFGAGFTTEEGYSFIPDGSGAIIDFADMKETTSVISAKMYGNDFGFYQASGGGNMQTWKYPVYGIVSDRDLTELKITEVPILYEDYNGNIPVTEEEGTGLAIDKDGNYITKQVREVLNVTEGVRQGYFAIIEEGDSLAKLSNEYGGTLHPCASSFITVYPRQSDSYPLDGITVSGQTATYEVDCERKYVGNFRTRYIMLFEDNASYVGMANIYRDYLKANGSFGEMIKTDNQDTTLYLEAFGDVDTIEKFLGMPVEVKTALTSFENAQVMLSLLQGKVLNQTAADCLKKIYPSQFEGINAPTVEQAQKVLDDMLLKTGYTPVKSLALRYVGWYNGGMTHTPPSKLDVDSVIGGEEGLKNLVGYLNENNIAFYPDLEYSYVKWTGMFDEFDANTDTAKTVDGKSAWSKSYDYIFQTLGVTDNDFVLLSSVALEKYYNNIKDKFLSFGTSGVSLGSLGNNLNSSQDENEPVNREEAKEQILDMMNNFSTEGKDILVNGGNSYVLQYADVILGAPLDSNARVVASYEIPFVGMVLHGYKDFTGEAINLAGDYEYAILKTIENGASPYFVLSYENTSELKTNGLTQYYAIQFDIWYDEVLESYNKLNSALKKVSNAIVVAHEFVADRVVLVTYDNGVSFLLNYNNAVVEVEVDGTNYNLGAMEHVVLQSK